MGTAELNLPSMQLLFASVLPSFPLVPLAAFSIYYHTINNVYYLIIIVEFLGYILHLNSDGHKRFAEVEV